MPLSQRRHRGEQKQLTYPNNQKKAPEIPDKCHVRTRLYVRSVIYSCCHIPLNSYYRPERTISHYIINNINVFTFLVYKHAFIQEFMNPTSDMLWCFPSRLFCVCYWLQKQSEFKLNSPSATNPTPIMYWSEPRTLKNWNKVHLHLKHNFIIYMRTFIRGDKRAFGTVMLSHNAAFNPYKLQWRWGVQMQNILLFLHVPLYGRCKEKQGISWLGQVWLIKKEIWHYGADQSNFSRP